jgi:hypothetical protein
VQVSAKLASQLGHFGLIDCKSDAVLKVVSTLGQHDTELGAIEQGLTDGLRIVGIILLLLAKLGTYRVPTGRCSPYHSLCR